MTSPIVYINNELLILHHKGVINGFGTLLHQVMTVNDSQAAGRTQRRLRTHFFIRFIHSSLLFYLDISGITQRHDGYFTFERDETFTWWYWSMFY